MKRFMLLTYGLANPTPEMMTAWGAWQTSVADRIVEHGGFHRVGGEISRSGTRELTVAADAITGYCILKAESFEEAEAIAGRTPFIAGIRVYKIA